MVTTTADLAAIPTEHGVLIVYKTEDANQTDRHLTFSDVHDCEVHGFHLDPAMGLPMVVEEVALAYLLINMENDAFRVSLHANLHENGVRVEFS